MFPDGILTVEFVRASDCTNDGADAFVRSLGQQAEPGCPTCLVPSVDVRTHGCIPVLYLQRRRHARPMHNAAASLCVATNSRFEVLPQRARVA